MSNPFFHFKQFSILHQEKGLKVTTDACLLGAIADSGFQPNNILDIGTGTGVIALMLAQRFNDSVVTAIEIAESVAHNALSNFVNSPFKSRLNLLHDDVLKHDFDEQFDLIVCNPPYFKNHLQKQEAERAEKNMAIHNLTLNEVELCNKVKTLLSDTGSFWMIYPSELIHTFISTAEHSNLSIAERITVFNEQEKPYRDIIAFRKNRVESVKTDHLFIRENGQYSEKYRKLMSDFYLDDTQKYKS